MKLASLKQGRDGRLALVTRDLSRAVLAQAVETLQAALDDWAAVAPKLVEEAAALEDGHAAGAFTFEENTCASPLPRAHQWADGSAYVNHVKLVRQARGADLPKSFWEDPLMYQGGSDAFLGPHDPVDVAEEDWGIDLEAEVAVVTDDVPMGVTAEQAARHIKLVMLVNDVSLRNLIPGELGKGFGFFQAKPSTAFSPLALTPDELGAAWDGGRLHLPLLSRVNGKVLGKPDAGEDMTFDFPTLIAHAAKTRPLTAGSIIGSGTVSNRDHDGGPGKPVAEGGRGYSCLAEVRMVEKIRTGEIATDFLAFGDRVRIEMLDADSQSLFGAIDQEVRRYAGP
ncbi:fumarylacetoacetate hydrolase family protein [Algihabitans albus]|uniref:fumarylacetoacetate hydrolase family protein n=1 Tax=Algihabitans albus TaxID=2164067 RepID=UPI000E5D1084|nr:fumarylacetoacetate hydrolase family protein [Algihabitans albus]